MLADIVDGIRLGGLIVAIVAAASTYRDAMWLRASDARITPWLWAILVFFAWPLALPAYLILRTTVWKKEATSKPPSSAAGSAAPEPAAFRFRCTCGRTLSADGSRSGTSISCECGQVVAVPSLSRLRAETVERVELVQDAADPLKPAPEKIIGPSPAELRWGRDGRPDKRVPVACALTSEALWIQDVWKLQSVPLQDIVRRPEADGRDLALDLGAERMTLTFAVPDTAETWRDRVWEYHENPSADAAPADRRRPVGVSLLRQAPGAAFETAGDIEFAGPNQRDAERGLQLSAGLRGADAVINVKSRRRPELGFGARQVWGSAIRVDDAAERERLPQRWYFEQVCSLANRMLVLLFVYAAFLTLVLVLLTGGDSLNVPSRESPKENLLNAVLGLGLLYGWPIAVVLLLRVIRWPQLLRAAGLMVLVSVTGRELTVLLAHVLAVVRTDTALADSKLWMMLDPFGWAFAIIGLSLCIRAWRLATEARQLIPKSAANAPTGRKLWSRAVLATSVAFGIAFVGFIGVLRYEESVTVLQPGFDARAEHEGHLALDEGLRYMDQRDWPRAEQSLRRALPLWERLGARATAPLDYRGQLMCTLNNLGCVCENLGRDGEAEQLYQRVLSLSEAAGPDAKADEYFQIVVKYARERRDALRGSDAAKQIVEKDQAARRKSEEAAVAFEKGDARADSLYQEAIAIWEELLLRASAPESRKYLVQQLAAAHAIIAECKPPAERAAAEAAIKKAIHFGEQSVTLDPDRPYPKHQLEQARAKLEALREEALVEEIAALWRAERFATALELIRRRIEEDEQRLSLDAERAAAERRLAHRLDSYAWHLAHCPDDRVRDARSAVGHARRATQLQPGESDHWYTLAMVQYRNDRWADSMSSLEKVKELNKELDANAWFLSAMNLLQLKRKDEARAALKKGVDWFDDLRRKSEDHPILRYRFEWIRPDIERMRREAEQLLDGKGLDRTGIG